MDTLVFDIETKNSFEDVGGRENIRALEASVIGVYSYTQDRYVCFDEGDFTAFGEMARNASLLVGFSSKRFDVPVVEKHFAFKFSKLPHFDILEEIEGALGRRISLGILAEANLGIGRGKTGTGLDAIAYYRRGELDKLREYCLQDVKVTKEIFDLIRSQGYLWIPQRNAPQMIKLPITYRKAEAPLQARLL